MEQQKKSTSIDLFGPEEARDALENCFNVIDESDRGAVLMAAAMVDDHMRRLFEVTASSRMSPKQVKTLLRYPSPLSSLAAKAEVGLATGLINQQIYAPIQVLRNIRNEVAHSPATFQLSDHEPRIREMMHAMGEGFATMINETAIKGFLDMAVDSILKNETMAEYVKTGDLDREKIIRRMADDKDQLEVMSKRASRFELGFAVATLCALIVWRWKKNADEPN